MLWQWFPAPSTFTASEMDFPLESTLPGTRDAPMTVSAFLGLAGQCIEEQFHPMWLEGETSNVKKAQSGHIYFRIVDKKASLNCVMWRSSAQRQVFHLEDGQHIVCRGRPAIYAGSGAFQFYVQRVEAAGAGNAALALKQLTEKLRAEGLFDMERKRPLPRFPRQIGVVTSQTGAAIRDIIRAVEKKWPTPIIVSPALVQGAHAADSMVQAFVRLEKLAPDLIIIGRGGGSKEDLAEFNDERLVRTIADCTVPVISAVGHEVDTTLCDFVADIRAATPTMAGEMAVPSKDEIRSLIDNHLHRLGRATQTQLRETTLFLDNRLDGMKHLAAQHLNQCSRRLKDLVSRLERKQPLLEVREKRNHLQRTERTLHERTRQVLASYQDRLKSVERLMAPAAKASLFRKQKQMGETLARLEALSPLAVLERGYSLVQKENVVIHSAANVQTGDEVSIRFFQGSATCSVTKVDPE